MAPAPWKAGVAVHWNGCHTVQRWHARRCRPSNAELFDTVTGRSWKHSCFPSKMFLDRVKVMVCFRCFTSLMVFLSLGSEKFQGIQRTETFYVSLPKYCTLLWMNRSVDLEPTLINNLEWLILFRVWLCDISISWFLALRSLYWATSSALRRFVRELKQDQKHQRAHAVPRYCCYSHSISRIQLLVPSTCESWTALKL